MNQKQKTVLRKLLFLYTELYPANGIFKSNFFTYTPEEVADIIQEIENLEEMPQKKSIGFIRDDILKITSIEQVRDYISKLDLLNGKYETLTENKAATAVTLAEYKYLYSILYTTPINSKIKKEILINHIVKYFDGIDRAHSLKP